MPITSLTDITADDVKTYHGLKLTDTSNDTRINYIIPLVADEIKEYCRHDFTVKSRDNETPSIPKCRSEFMLLHRPVQSITSLTEDGIELVENVDFTVRSYGKIVKESGYNIFNSGNLGYWSTSPAAISVTYVAGEALTQDVVMVALEIIGIRAGIKVRTYVDNEGVEASANIVSIPKEYRNILDLHKHSPLTRSSTV